MPNMRVLLVGCGKMGGAMLARWQTLSLTEQCYVIDPFQTTVPYGTLLSTIEDLPISFKPDVIIFAVKPQTLPDIIEAYTRFAADALYLSIAAGKPISFFEKSLGTTAHIIRAMPNTPAAVGAGITVACANQAVTPEEKESAAALLGAVGDFLWVEGEALLDPITALSGSGPAYVFLLIEAMTKAAIKIGLTQDMAAKLARQTVIGSAVLADQSPDVPAETLRENVTSPGGTTAAALDILMNEPAMQDLFDRALQAATTRAKELSKS